MVFYHPGRPGLHKRLRAEYRGPVYVEASHPAAALLGGVELGWEVAGLALAPVYSSVYYWEESLRAARGEPARLYELLSQALAKRLDLFMPPRLAGRVEVGVVPETGMVGGWVFDATPGHTLLYSLYHLASWISGLNLAGEVRLYVEVSLASPVATRALVDAGFVATMWLAGLGHRVDFRVFGSPSVGPGPWRTPLVPLVELGGFIAGGVERGVAAALGFSAGSVLWARGRGVRVPERLARRLKGFARDARVAALAVFLGLPHAVAALLCGAGSGGGFRLVSRLFSELVSADLSSVSIRSRVGGGVVAHGLGVGWESLLLAALWGAFRDAYSWLCRGLRVDELAEAAARLGSPGSRIMARLLKNAVIERGSCDESALEHLLLVEGAVRLEDGFVQVDAGCVRRVLGALLEGGEGLSPSRGGG